MKVIFYLLYLVLVNGSKMNETFDGYEKSEILSRRKRFLIFPEGSSLQLVFCNTYPTIFRISDIFLWGVTAALAWELPQDPYSPFDHKADPLHRRTDTKMIYYTSEEGKVIYKRPYTQKLIVNPAFAKRSVHQKGIAVGDETKKVGIDRKKMHAENKRHNFGAADRRSVEFHRSARASLYRKIEAMLQGLGTDGKQCMLKTLCKVGKTQDHPQGSFFQEILRTTFSLPQGSNVKLNEYDEAFSAAGDCDELYPDCEERLNDPLLTR